MTSGYRLLMSGRQHQTLVEHLIAPDGKEAAAILLCRDAGLTSRRLMVNDLIVVPYDCCGERARDFISWPGEMLSDAVDAAEEKQLSIILIHSHPGGLYAFSETDDKSDQAAVGSVFGGWSGPAPDAGHGSAVMVPSGHIRARLYGPNLVASAIEAVGVIGDDILLWNDDDVPPSPPMAFGSGMTKALNKMHACVIGVSGTGSIIAEQAARMGFGELTLIDFDKVERKNLNRILNSTLKDAEADTAKVSMFAAAASRYRGDLTINTVEKTIFSREAVMAAARADVIFSCVDSSEGRQIADLVAQAFMLPLIDMGVTIPTRKTKGGDLAIAEVMGRVDYVQPHGSTLLDRGVYTPASLRAEYLARVDPQRFAEEIAEGYIKGAPNEAPSVITLNMRAASAAMLEFLARTFPFRHDSNSLKARTLFALADGEEEIFSEDEFMLAANFPVGTGLAAPLLGLPALED